MKKYLSLLVLSGLSLMLLVACGNDANTPKMVDYFATTEQKPLSRERQQLFASRKMTEARHQHIKNMMQRAAREAKENHAKMSWDSISYDKDKKLTRIKKLTLDYELLQTGEEEHFENIKDVEVSWYDEKNTLPHFFKLRVENIFTPTEEYLQSEDGRTLTGVLKKLKLETHRLLNYTDIVYEYLPETGQMAMAVDNDFNHLLQARLVVRLDSISEQLFQMMGTLDAADMGLLLGMLPAVRLQESYLKLKLQRNIHEIFDALPPDDAKQLRQDYQKFKTMSDQEFKKENGLGLSLEQIAQYRQVLTRFLEDRQALIVHIQPQIPQAISAVVTSAVLVGQNPQKASEFIKQLNIRFSNQ